MKTLEKSLRNKLEKTVKDAREIAEAGARAALEQIGVESPEAYAHLAEEERDLRRRLRAHGRQLGDVRGSTGEQEIGLLAEETAYQHWHRMLFARFLAENDLLMFPDPDEPVAVTLEECEDMAADEGARNGWELAARYASRMLPQIFRQDSPVLELEIPPEHQQKLERILADLPREVFAASDSIGWVYQFWQAKRKDEVNASGVKIGARELPAVTQLFTEQYMVSFLLDNSLGAWWAARRLTPEDLKTARTEEELRQKASIPGVPLTYLRFVKVTRASSSGAPDAASAPRKVTRASSSGAPDAASAPRKVTRASSSGAPDAAPAAPKVTRTSTPPIGFDESTLKKSFGEHLPHWTCNKATYHVSFRLADSVPESQTRQWLRERQSIIDNANRTRRELTQDEEKKVRFLYSDRIEKYLDAGHGECHLANPKAAELVANALLFFDGKRYRLHAWSVMPNHVHVVVEPYEKESLSAIIHSWKSFTANECNKLLGLKGQFWQNDAYNHIIRTEKEYWFQIRYAWSNPDRAKLKDWRWRWRIDEGAGQDGLVALNTPGQDGLVTLDSLKDGLVTSDSPDQDGLVTLETPGQDGLVTLWEPAAGGMDGWPANLGELKTLDPCCGSGHFLVSAFLMLVPMRMEMEELSARDAVGRVLSENIHGLEIDGRCVELAAFSLAFAAWRYPGAGGYRTLPELKVACSGLSVRIPKSEWKNVARIFPDKSYIPIALDWLYEQYKDAAFLGSLIDPSTAQVASLVDWNAVIPLLNEALTNEGSEEFHESGVVARGLAECTKLLAGKYSWVITNVPYLARGKQNPALQDFCSKYYKDAKNDLATVFLERCLEFCEKGGSVSIILPQNWLFLTSYKKLREKFLRNENWDLIARLGPRAFETISGEVVKAILINMGRANAANQSGELSGERHENKLIRGLDISELCTVSEKAAGLKTAEIKSIEQIKQLKNPDARVAFSESHSMELVEKYADTATGIQTFDRPRFIQFHWEKDGVRDGRELCQSTVDSTLFFGGCEFSVLWENGSGQLFKLMEDKKNLEGYTSAIWKAGSQYWGQKGILISLMGNLAASLYNGNPYDQNAGLIKANEHKDLITLWSFCSSSQFASTVREVDQSLKVTNATLGKIPIDWSYWTKVANDKYHNGLPEPYSDDPTQWIFHGHPCGSVIWDEDTKWTSHGPLRTNETVLQVAVARLLGYRWPAELDEDMELADEQRQWVNRCEALLSYADEDGIVCIPPVRGEASAAERLLKLLAAAYGDAWSNNILSQLLKSVDHEGKTLETWLRDKFFVQHCKLFQHRPFIWHVWDGLNDGFSALVNYHKLDRKKLETLVYTYLGDWIRCQRQDIADGIDGAAEKLAAAEALKKRLELILEGEAPYDIFVRWKPVEEQPVGWNPDLNDGVRLNIRPFMTVPDVKKKGAGVLRDKPNIKWDKDRGKDVPSAPWYDLGPKFGGKEGDRINDHHLTLKEKISAQNKIGYK